MNRRASDAPVESLDVLHAIECCVTREGFEPQQALSAAEALRLFTSGAARLQFEESEKGALRAGLRADLVLLSANPLAVEAGLDATAYAMFPKVAHPLEPR